MTGSTNSSIDLRDVPILLVEDDDGDALLVCASLEDAGIPDHHVTRARTLADALELIDVLDAVPGDNVVPLAAPARRPGCVLLDLGLPDASGYGGVSKIVAIAPRTPVIVLTGRQERDGVEALTAGAQDYLIKDAVNGEMLRRSIRYAIERTRAQATQEQLNEITVSAAEQARLERGLLPTPLLRTDAVGCSTYYRPGRDDAVLGGDFYDVVETADGQVRAIIGDVMGHGPDEAALGVHLRVAWRTLLLAGVPDEQILPTMARLLSAEADQISRYVTVCDLTLEPGRLSVRLAGHPAPILCAPGERARYLDVQIGIPLGVSAAIPRAQPWPLTEVELPPGSSLLLYTDGLLDAFFDMDQDSIGVEELVAAVDSCQRTGGPPAAWVPTLLAAAPRDSIDDTAAVVLTASAGG